MKKSLTQTSASLSPARTTEPAAAAPLGGMTAQHFLTRYWQKRPLLIRQAFPGFASADKAGSNAPVDVQTLFRLAAQDDVESRLVAMTGAGTRARWTLDHGPFDSMPRARKNWTLLVQGVNLHHAAADDILRQFSFLPNTRLDDLMVSYAVDGGGVGPHFDSYDVFLIQAEGKRRWRISAQTDLELVDGLPLKILQNFQAEEEWLLEPGDMLYLPPQYAHEGTAAGSCMTYSVGFRAPAWQEVAEGFLTHLADRVALPGRYQDARRTVTDNPAKIDDHLLTAVTRELAKIQWDEHDIVEYLGESLSEPKVSVFFDAPTPLTIERFASNAAQNGIRLHRKTQMLYRNRQIFINGETCNATGGERTWLQHLADRRSATARNCAMLLRNEALCDLLYEWYNTGWIIFSVQE